MVRIVNYLVTLKVMLKHLLNACIMCRIYPTYREGVGRAEEM